MQITTTTKSVLDRIVTALQKSGRAAALSFFLKVAPVPASRPRVTRWGTYYGKKYTQFRADAGFELSNMTFDKLEGPCVVVIDIVVQRPKTSKLDAPRGDVDNYLKAIMDSMTKADVWKDDDQVVLVSATKRFAADGEEPGFNIRVFPLGE